MTKKRLELKKMKTDTSDVKKKVIEYILKAILHKPTK